MDEREKAEREKAERRKAQRQEADWAKLELMKEPPPSPMTQEFRDRCFEVQKHVATLSTAAALLILAVYRARPFEQAVLALTLGLLALSTMAAVHGMAFQAKEVRGPGAPILGYDKHIERTTGYSSELLILAVLMFALYGFNVPIWLALGVLVVSFVVFLRE